MISACLMYLRIYLPALLVGLLASTVSAQPDDSKQYTFALIPKNIDSQYFDVSRDGCVAKAAQLGNVVCKYVGTKVADAKAQAEIIVSLIDQNIDGMSVSVLDEEITGEAINTVMEAGIPVITFDSDAPKSRRIVGIGTDNKALGSEIGKVLVQLRPEGGKYGTITGAGPNLALRVQGLRERLNESAWLEAEGSPKDCKESVELSLDQMEDLATDPDVRAILSVGGWPMGNPNTTRWKSFVDANRDVTTVCSDSSQLQLSLMGQGYVDGLVGQMPYVMGEQSMKILLGIKSGETPEEIILGTHLLEVLRVPLSLPELSVNKNYIGTLVVLGYVLFAIIAILSIGLVLWVAANRAVRVVKTSQPIFLIMICVGTLLMSSSIIPLTIDDENYSQKACNSACMSFPWLFSIGFTTTFSALFSKTWRINKILNNPNQFRKIKVAEKDVTVPYFALLLSNIIVLACWTAIAPLIFVRKPHAGTDEWNRIISTYGQCTSDKAVIFASILAIINLGVLIVANVQSYIARSIHTEFSESRYITLTVASMLQAFVLAIPIIFLVGESPQAYFVVVTVLIFVTCLAVLVFIFLPKIKFAKKWKKERARKATSSRASSMDTGIRFTSREPSSTDTGMKFTRAESTEMVNQHNMVINMISKMTEDEKHDILLELQDGGGSRRKSDDSRRKISRFSIDSSN